MRAEQHELLAEHREAAIAAIGQASWRDAVSECEEVIRLAGSDAAASDHERFAQSLLRLRRLDDAHTALLVATSQHPGSARVRELALETFRRQRAGGVELDLVQLARQYIRRYTTASESASSVGIDTYSTLFLARSGSLQEAGRSLSRLIGVPGFLDATESNDIRVLLDLAVRQHQFAAAERLIDHGRARFGDDPKLAVLSARFLNATRQHAEAADVLTRVFAEHPEVDTTRNRMHLVRAMSSDDRLIEAHGVLTSIDDDERPAAEQIKLVCKAIDTRFALTHIDPVVLPDSDAPLCDRLDDVVATAESWTSSDPTAAGLRSAGLERTITTTVLTATRVGLHGRRLPPADTAGPLLDVVFGDRSWSGTTLGTALDEAIVAGDTHLDDHLTLFESELADPELFDRHPALKPAALERLVLWHGGLRVAHVVNRVDWERRFAKGVATLRAGDLQDAIGAACQLGRNDAVPELFGALERDVTQSAGRLAAVRGYVDLLSGDRRALVASFDDTSTAAERELSDFLRGKAIAIVGPAPGDQPNGAEIDSFDVVVRPNRLLAPPPDQVDRHGSRTDIVSFAATRARQLRHVVDPAARDLDPAVGFALFKYRAAQLSGGGPAVPVSRHALRHVHSYAMRQLNHLPQLIFYLNSFDISRLKIFNANFFLARDRWESDYVPDGRTGDLLTQLVFSDSLDVGHWFVRSLYRSQILEADEQGASVLGLDTERYMREMSELVTR